MNALKNFWNNFKTRPDIWFFYGFLLTFTLFVRKVLFFYPINGQFNEYSGIYLYLSDIFLILTVVFWGTFILRNKSEYLSSIKQCFGLNNPLLKILLIFNLWIFISILWSDNQVIALFRAIKILEFNLLFLYIIVRIVPCGKIYKKCHPEFDSGSKVFLDSGLMAGMTEAENVSHETFLQRVFQIIIFIGLFQAIIGIWQYLIQHSVGLFWLKESLISPNIPGVAKVIFGGEKFIRAYGLFPHPNILGGFLLFSIIITWVYWKLIKIPLNPPFTKEENGIVPCGTIFKLSPFLKGRNKEGFLKIALFIQFIALMITFSKSAILGLIMAILYIFLKIYRNRIVPCGTIHKNLLRNMFQVEHIKRLLLLSLISLLLIIAIKPNINSLILKSLNERIIYLNLSDKIISDNPIFGIGNGQFVLEMQKYSVIILESWQFQPVHNVFLLIWSELGLIGLILFLWFLWRIFKFSPFSKGRLERDFYLTIILKSVVIGFIFIMLFDHYFWDIQQGQILFWLTAGLLVGVNSIGVTTVEN